MISLENSIKTCKVDDAWASRVQSDRFLNPNNAVCPVWNGLDTAGRPVCSDSFAIKSGGCHNANDRVVVENHLRPNYIEYVNLSSRGYGGNLYDSPGYGNFGINMSGVQEQTSCNNPYETLNASCGCSQPDTCSSRVSSNTGYATSSTPVMSSSYMKGIMVPTQDEVAEGFKHQSHRNNHPQAHHIRYVENFNHTPGQYQSANQAQNNRQRQYLQNQYASANNRSCSGF